MIRFAHFILPLNIVLGAVLAMILYLIIRRQKAKLFFLRLISASADESMKRFIALILVFVYISSHYLIMYFKLEIANTKLVEQTLDGIKWMAITFGGLVALDKVSDGWNKKVAAWGAAEMKRAEQGVPQNVVTQKVENQDITAAGNINLQGITTTTTTLQNPD